MGDHWLLLHLKHILKNQFPSQTVLQNVLLHNGLKVNALLFLTAGTKQVNKTYSFAMIPKKVFVSLYIPVKSTDFGGSLPIFYLPTANLPIYHNLPISTDFFADLPNFNFF